MASPSRPPPLPDLDRLACASDGERLRYGVLGTGPPLLLLNGLVSSIQHWAFFIADHQERFSVVAWDYRGHGGAPPPRDPRTLRIEQYADDAQVVLEAAGLGPAVLVALSFGVQVALEHYRRHPGDVRALVLICGTAGYPLDRLSPAPALRRAFVRAAQAFGRSPRLARLVQWPLRRTSILRHMAYLSGGAHRDLCPREVLDGLSQHVAALDPRVLGESMASYFGHSAFDVLESVRVPTLIIAGDRDQLTPVSCAERMHRAVAGSKLLVVPGHSHLVQVERPQLVHRAIAEFLG
jgi:pimeloyl-ACP methyl ester carboxylesterase